MQGILVIGKWRRFYDFTREDIHRGGINIDMDEDMVMVTPHDGFTAPAPDCGLRTAYFRYAGTDKYETPIFEFETDITRQCIGRGLRKKENS